MVIPFIWGMKFQLLGVGRPDDLPLVLADHFTVGIVLALGQFSRGHTDPYQNSLAGFCCQVHGLLADLLIQHSLDVGIENDFLFDDNVALGTMFVDLGVVEYHHTAVVDLGLVAVATEDEEQDDDQEADDRVQGIDGSHDFLLKV